MLLAQRIRPRRVGTGTRLRIAFGTFDDTARASAREQMIHQNAKLAAGAECVNQVFASAVVIEPVIEPVRIRLTQQERAVAMRQKIRQSRADYDITKGRIPRLVLLRLTVRGAVVDIV